MYRRPIWFKLLGPPLELWIEELLKVMGNTIGKFIGLEQKFHSKFNKKVIKLLVELIFIRATRGN